MAAIGSPVQSTAKAAAPQTGKRVGVSAQAEWILVRIACPGGATRAETARDLRPLLDQQRAAAAWRSSVDASIAELIAAGLAADVRNRLRTTPTGLEQAQRVLDCPIDGAVTWAAMRDGPLTALALGLPPADKAVLKALASPDALRALIVQQAYGLGGGRPMSLSKLRAALAVRALEHAFGNQIKSGLGSGSGLASKPSRVLAGQLSRTPKDYGSDGRLIAALAAEHMATATSEADALRAALLTRLVAGGLAVHVLPPQQAAPPAALAPYALPDPPPAQVPANDPGRLSERPLPAARPDLAGFIREVQRAASRRAEGWPGNRKAFISHIWQEIKSAHPAWSLSEIEFKAMLAEAHRTGGLVLTGADLKDKKHIQDFENSAIQYKNAVWHFVRVEEI
jgi:hypothetical protein